MQRGLQATVLSFPVRDPKRADQGINRAVAKILEQFPPKTHASVPVAHGTGEWWT